MFPWRQKVKESHQHVQHFNHVVMNEVSIISDPISSCFLLLLLSTALLLDLDPSLVSRSPLRERPGRGEGGGASFSTIQDFLFLRGSCLLLKTSFSERVLQLPSTLLLSHRAAAGKFQPGILSCFCSNVHLNYRRHGTTSTTNTETSSRMWL